jgi:hypothetical protein
MKNLKTNLVLNNFILGIKTVSKAIARHLDTVFLVLFFIVKFVLPKIVLPKYFCLPTIPNVSTNLVLEDMFSTSLQQETLMFLMLSQFIVKFTVKISVLFLTAITLVVLAAFCVFLFLGKNHKSSKVNVNSKPALIIGSFYNHKIQFLN